jgi:D-arabinose 1-dehydrogenase-like Zn-dependent alcohol dehydrogenase
MVTRTYSLEQINEACLDLRQGKIAGRAIVKF